MNRNALLFPLAVLALATGCPQTTDCTTEAVSSVNLTVVDDAGAPIADAVARYSVDGGDEADCEAMSAAGEFVCGWEEAGDFAITVEAEGFLAGSATATVGEDECHVIPEAVEVVLELDEITCTTEEVPSIEVTVTNAAGADVDDATVMWNMAAEDDLDDPCESAGTNVWHCGFETAGELRVDVMHDDYTTISELITVGEDECHVITEAFDAVLQPL